MEINEEIKERLLKIIKDSGLTRRSFAGSLGVSATTISDIINNKIASLSQTMVIMLKLKYGINPVWLETGSGKKYLETIVAVDQDEVFLIERIRLLSVYNKDLLRLFLGSLLQMQELEEKEAVKAKKKVIKRKS